MEMKTYQWERSVNTDHWVGLAATISDHQRLGADRLATLLQALRETIDQIGGTVHA